MPPMESPCWVLADGVCSVEGTLLMPPPGLALVPPSLAGYGTSRALLERHLHLETANLQLAAQNALLRVRCTEALNIAAMASSKLACSGAMATGESESQATTTDTDSDVVVLVEEMLPPWEEPPPSEPGTSLMLRNIPNNFSRTMLVDLLDVRGFAGMYDFVYLPLDFKSQANLGYAFFNFVDNEYVKGFWQAFHGFTAWSVRGSDHRGRLSAKVGRVEWNKIQGLGALTERFRNSPVMHKLVPEEHKPLLIIDGIEAAFPEPTQLLKAPQRRKPAQSDAKQQP